MTLASAEAMLYHALLFQRIFLSIITNIFPSISQVVSRKQCSATKDFVLQNITVLQYLIVMNKYFYEYALI